MGIANDAALLNRKFTERRQRLRLQADSSASATRLQANRFEVAVYFSDPPTHLYQLRQWFEPLTALAEAHPVVLISRSASATRQLQRDCPLPVVYAATHSDIDPLVEQQPLKIALYVNHNQRNFALLWQPSIAHVYIGHGESDKIGISASNQLKAYDYCFVAGQAAIDRIRHRLINYDADARVIEIGRPQVDFLPEGPVRRNDRTVVLYAPSWEGDRPANAYGSLASHGEAIVSSLVASGAYRVIFRPHPLSGSRRPEFAVAKARIADLLKLANRRDPRSGHVIDTSADFGWQLQAADACFADISAVAYDWLATRKPLVITEPADTNADVDPRGIAGAMSLLTANRAADSPLVLTEATGEESLKLIDSLATYYFGNTANGASTHRWLNAVERLIGDRDRAVAVRDAAQWRG